MTYHCCEHGDHPCPAGRRFCSPACAACEAQYDPEDPAHARHICTAPLSATEATADRKRVGARP